MKAESVSPDLLVATTKPGVGGDRRHGCVETAAAIASSSTYRILPILLFLLASVFFGVMLLLADRFVARSTLLSDTRFCFVDRRCRCDSIIKARTLASTAVAVDLICFACVGYIIVFVLLLKIKLFRIARCVG